MFTAINHKIFALLFSIIANGYITMLCAACEHDKKTSFAVVADTGQFTKSDLHDIPFGRKACPTYEERYFLVEKGTEIPGGIISFSIDDESATIETLGIRENLQKKGHGQRLMQHIFTILKARGIKNVSLIPTADSGPFYRKNGFTFGKMGLLERNL